MSIVYIHFQFVCQSVSQTVIPSFSRFVGQSFTQLVCHSVSHSAYISISYVHSQLVVRHDQSVSQSVTVSVSQSVSQSVR